MTEAEMTAEMILQYLVEQISTGQDLEPLADWFLDALLELGAPSWAVYEFAEELSIAALTTDPKDGPKLAL